MPKLPVKSFGTYKTISSKCNLLFTLFCLSGYACQVSSFFFVSLSRKEMRIFA